MLTFWHDQKQEYLVRLIKPRPDGQYEVYFEEGGCLSNVNHWEMTPAPATWQSPSEPAATIQPPPPPPMNRRCNKEASPPHPLEDWLTRHIESIRHTP